MGEDTQGCVAVLLSLGWAVALSGAAAVVGDCWPWMRSADRNPTSEFFCPPNSLPSKSDGAVLRAGVETSVGLHRLGSGLKGSRAIPVAQSFHRSWRGGESGVPSCFWVQPRGLPEAAWPRAQGRGGFGPFSGHGPESPQNFPPRLISVTLSPTSGSHE